MHRAVLAVLNLLAATAFAVGAPPTSITLDGSLGHAAGPVNPTSPGFYQITPSMGKSVGSNLFQSFGVFNLGTGDTADFEANPGTQNIIARVTGGSASTIDGNIESAANLYFINPAGIMFTANATLNINGAFVASTANYAKLSDGTIFYADTVHPLNDAGLTSAPISAFGFTSPTPAPVNISGAYLYNPGGINVIGGDITVDQDAIVYAPSANLTLFSAAGTGEVPFGLATPGAGFSSATNTAFGNITIQNGSRVAIDGIQGGGSVVIRGGKLTMNNAILSSENAGTAAGGDISVQADQIDMLDGGLIYASNSFAGAVGNITVKTVSLSIDGQLDQAGYNGIFDISYGSGNNGNLSVIAQNSITIANHGVITDNSDATGATGNVYIQAPTLTVNGALTPTLFTGIGNQTQGNSVTAPGSMTIDVPGTLTLDDGGQISGSTFSASPAGDVTVTARDITTIGSSATPPSYISDETFGSGKAGNITVTATDALSINGEGGVDSSAFSSGPAGSVTVHAGSMSIDGFNSSGDEANQSGVSSSSFTGASGAGGSVTVNVDHGLTISNGGFISSVTFTTANAGTVYVKAASIDLQGYTNSSGTSLSSPTGIFTDTFNAGNAGAVTVDAGSLTINSGGDAITGISSSSGTPNFAIKTTGDAGAVLVTVNGSIDISGTGAGIAVVTGPTGGNAGDITVDAGSIDMVNVNGLITIPGEGSIPGGITAQALGSGKGGSISVQAGAVTLDDADITAASVTDGGNITLEVGQLVYLLDSQIVATSSGGKGGNIRIDPPLLVLDSSTITANAQAGQGGDITIIAGDFLQNASFITASGTTDGTITISSPQVDLSGSLIPLSATLADDENRLRESCARSINHEFSSLVVVGRGGTESSPDELQPDFGMDTSSAALHSSAP